MDIRDEKAYEKIIIIWAFYDSMEVTEVSEDWQFDGPLDYVSDLGGSLGFLSGCCLFSILELLETAVTVALSTFCCNRQQTTI